MEAGEFIEQENIKYVILYANERLPFAVEGVLLKAVFENKTITIYTPSLIKTLPLAAGIK